MAIRKREWVTRKGERKEAWVVEYTDEMKRRRLRTFHQKKDASAFLDMVRSPLLRIGGLVTPLIPHTGVLEFTAPLPARNGNKNLRDRRRASRMAIADAFRAAYPHQRPMTSNIIIQVVALVPPAVAVMDVDNLLKPVLDALAGLLYVDDTQIIECLIRRTLSTDRCLQIKAAVA